MTSTSIDRLITRITTAQLNTSESPSHSLGFSWRWFICYPGGGIQFELNAGEEDHKMSCRVLGFCLDMTFCWLPHPMQLKLHRTHYH